MANKTTVHCRTGSLEKLSDAATHLFIVHCRTGSLEIGGFDAGHVMMVHCRTGSLEKRVQGGLVCI